MNRETKNIQFKIEDKGITTNDQGQEVGKIEAFGAMYDIVDDGNDIILKGAFNRTVKNSKSRAESRNNPYMLKMLWQHKTEDVIGGWYDIDPNNPQGLLCKGDILLSTTKGKEFYELAKAHMIDEFSIMYEVMTDGAKYNKSGVRELSELRLFSIDPVTFAMCDQTYLVGVKSLEDLESKAICGNTSGPIGPRDEAWDGAKAKSQIFDAAKKDDGSISPAIAKKYFMVCDGDGTKKGDYGYPFWYVGSDPHICVGAVKAIAGAIQGSRGADAPGGLKGKVEKLYKRINSKYSDATPLTPPWKDDGKGNHRHMQQKTVQEHYADEMCQDLLEDWQDVFICSLTCAILDAFTIGDQPEQDISEALDEFKELVLAKFVPEAVECNLSEYIADNTYSSSSSIDYTLQYGSDSKPNYGYMSNNRERSQKSGKPISATNQQKIDDHVKSLKSTAKKSNAEMRDHVKAMHDAADDMEDKLTNDGQKAGRSISAATSQAIKDYTSSVHDHADKAMSIMKDHTKAVRTAADDFATRMQGAEVPYVGDDPGTPDPGQQEGKGKNQVIPSDKTHNTQERSSEEDTVNEKDLELALAFVQGIKTAV